MSRRTRVVRAARQRAPDTAFFLLVDPLNTYTPAGSWNVPATAQYAEVYNGYYDGDGDATEELYVGDYEYARFGLPGEILLARRVRISTGAIRWYAMTSGAPIHAGVIAVADALQGSSSGAGGLTATVAVSDLAASFALTASLSGTLRRSYSVTPYWGACLVARVGIEWQVFAASQGGVAV